ncbi:MAG: sulfite exporter TauE/SafE family protein [Methanosarcinales archaeon]|nr:sulfite exporter TauE/SafE family protein [ANME-2 cluster archaeon]MDF1532455.1 sulfite exporter TauE/SafE family protein [ANME-2 cluster archaeon]MDW7776866.1 sulfite exporter TauE/SafE family protein [Methanosarcinales archaeon]
MDPILIAVIIFFLAVLFSMLGLGGALVYVPLFYWLGIDILVAIPTALLLNGITTSSAAITYLRKKMVDLHTAAPFIAASIIGAPIGAYFTQFTPVETLLWILSGVLALAGTQMIFSRNPEDNRIQVENNGRRIMIGLVFGFVIGAAAGLMGIGGGVFIVPALVMLGFGTKRASATSAVIVAFISFSGFLGHLGTGRLDMTLMAYTAVAAFLGGQVGSHLMHSKIQSKTIKQLFGAVLWIMAVKIVSGLL